jgi:hypothetical protein
MLCPECLNGELIDNDDYSMVCDACEAIIDIDEIDPIESDED